MTLTIKLRDLQSKLSRYVALVLSTYQSHPSYEILLFLAEYFQEMHLSTSHNGEGITEKEACECFQMLSSSLSHQHPVAHSQNMGSRDKQVTCTA